MRVVVDYNLCESNGVCESLAPDVFELGEDDNLYLLQEHPPESLRGDVRAAVDGCPKQALALEE